MLVRLRAVPLLGATCLAAATAAAQSYPAKPLRIIVPVAAGGATDILTRAVAQRLASVWQQQVLVDNRPGGGSNVGFDVAAKAPADGYTLLMAQPAFTVNVSLYKKLPYDPLRDFAPIILTAWGANVLVVHPSVPVRTLKEFIALAKSRPGQLSYGSAGNGTTPHLSGELLKSMTGIQMTHIPYRGAGASIVDLMGGHVDLAFVSLSSVVPLVKAGKLRAIAITSGKRSALMPALPTFIESGLPGFEVTGWFGLVAPTGTPREVVDRVHDTVANALAHADVLQTLTAVGLEPAAPNTPEQFGQFLKAEIEKWAKVVKVSGAKAE
jgi:tripartite-type tricarboxylate transporter receptor subunit TctC